MGGHCHESSQSLVRPCVTRVVKPQDTKDTIFLREEVWVWQALCVSRASVGASYGRHDKASHIGWLQFNRHLLSRTIQEARGLRSRCHQGCAPCKGTTGDSFLASSSTWSPGLWLPPSYLCLCPHMVFFSPQFSSHWIQGPPYIQDDFISRPTTNDICKDPIS